MMGPEPLGHWPHKLVVGQEFRLSMKMRRSLTVGPLYAADAMLSKAVPLRDQVLDIVVQYW